MSQLDAILARSHAPGPLKTRRRFTLSRERAVEKLRQFTLRDPSQYVLELVQAAVFHGATYVAVDVSADRVVVAWVGAPIIEEVELESLFDNLFADHGNTTRRHLVQLAMGTNALLRRPLRTLRIESGDGTRATRMDLDGKGHVTLGVPEGPLQGTYLVAEFKRPWWQRITAETFTPEQALVEERCRHTPVPILLNGSAPFGWKAAQKVEQFGLQSTEEFEVDGCRGVVGVVAHSARSNPGFALVVGGVEITRAELLELGQVPAELLESIELGSGICGVICDDRLRKTADQGDIVRDERFVRMLHAVRPAARRAINRHARRRVDLPELPPLSQTTIVPGVARDVAAVPSPIRQLSGRPDLELHDLRSLADGGTPLLRVRPAEAGLLSTLAGPAILPFPVVILDDPQGRGLEQALGGTPIPQLASANDVEMARRLAEGQAPARTVRLAMGSPDTPVFAVSLPTGRSELRLDLHIGNGVPAIAAEGTVLAVIPSQSGGAGQAAQGGPPGLPRIVATWSGEAPPTPVSALCWVAAAHAIALLPLGETDAWDALPEATTVGLADLAAGLLAWASRPCAATQDGGIQLSLPPLWHARGDGLLGAPLARCRDGSALTARRLLAAGGTAEVFWVDDPEGAARVAILEERWSPGRVWHPPREQVLFAVVPSAAGWVAWDGQADLHHALVVHSARTPNNAGPVPLTPGRGWLAWWGQPAIGAEDALLVGILAWIENHSEDASIRHRDAAQHAAAELAMRLGAQDTAKIVRPPFRDLPLVTLPTAVLQGWVPSGVTGGVRGLLHAPAHPLSPELVLHLGDWHQGLPPTGHRPLQASGLTGALHPRQGPGRAWLWMVPSGPTWAPLTHAVDVEACATPEGRERLPAVLARALSSTGTAPLPTVAHVLGRGPRTARSAHRQLVDLLEETGQGQALLLGVAEVGGDSPLAQWGRTAPAETQWALVLSLAADRGFGDLRELHEALIDVLTDVREP